MLLSHCAVMTQNSLLGNNYKQFTYTVTQPCYVFVAHEANVHQLVFLKNEKRQKKTSRVFDEMMSLWTLAKRRKWGNTKLGFQLQLCPYFNPLTIPSIANVNISALFPVSLVWSVIKYGSSHSNHPWMSVFNFFLVFELPEGHLT